MKNKKNNVLVLQCKNVMFLVLFLVFLFGFNVVGAIETFATAESECGFKREYFNAAWYYTMNYDDTIKQIVSLKDIYVKDLQQFTDRLYKDYNERGYTKGYSPSPGFDPKYYLSHHNDLLKTFGSTNYTAALKHFCDQPLAGNEITRVKYSPYFNASEYKKNHGDLSSKSYCDLYKHFIRE